MDKILQGFLISITIAIPTCIGLWRYREIDKQYRPFIWVCCLSTANEILRFILIKYKIYSFANYNLALPVSIYFYLLLFKRWGFLSGKKLSFYGLYFILFAVWFCEHFITSDIHARTYYSRICNSVVLVLLSVNGINKLIVTEKKSLYNNSKFIICITLVVYYTYRIIFDAFLIKGLSKEFLNNIGDINRYSLLGFNLILAIAVLWIPAKKNYSIPF